MMRRVKPCLIGRRQSGALCHPQFAGAIQRHALGPGLLKLPLAKQVQIACDQVKNGLARLASVEPPKFEDHETTFTQLQERITKTLTFIDSMKPEQIDGTEKKEIKFSIKEWNFEFIGEQYLLAWIIPNFYFHVTTAYNILRHNGLQIGKADYLGG